jgi:predicted acylesterase/phospholipase RssA
MTAYIKPVDSATLAERSATGRLDPGADLLLPAERLYIASRRSAHRLDSGRNELAALCLSGGGIRSAAFALGIMQKLAGENYLRLFDYLSTVSGGGYIGSSLTWLTSTEFHTKSQVQFGVGPSGGDAPFPYGTESPIAATPRHPPRPEDRFLTYLRSHGQYLIPGGGITLVSGIAVLLRGILLNLLVWLPIAAFLAALLGTAGFAGVLLAGEALWIVFVAASIVYSFCTIMRRSPEARRYRLRRFFETCAHWVLLWAVGLTVIGTLPFVDGAVHDWIGKNGGIGFLVSGAAGGIWSFFKSRSSDEGKLPLGTLAPIAALLFCYGFLIVAFDVAAATGSVSLHEGITAFVCGRALLCAVLLLAVALGLVVNLNYLTIHRYYRDRLMEAFMPDIELTEKNEAGPARAADPAALAAMCRDDDPRGPYHLINTNLILTGSADKTRRTRGGDSFILSPRYCGSNATGWRTTETFFDNQVTLATAMAISGAAANPNAGSGGVGITRNPIVSLVMSLLNVRLGMWVPNPGRKRQWVRPNHFEPGLLDLVDWRRTEASWTLRLSDGGHFDNLGIYEMVRRRAELIVVSDASADPDYSFSDLTEAMVRVKQDFGARIVFDDAPPLDALMPLADPLPFPLKTHRSKRGYARATITYSDGTVGTLLYLTTTIVEGLRLELLGYLSAHPTFPDETTADQFFSAAQFEAYRELGYVIAGQMLDGVQPAPGAGGPTDPADAGYRAEFESRLRRLGA